MLHIPYGYAVRRGEVLFCDKSAIVVSFSRNSHIRMNVDVLFSFLACFVFRGCCSILPFSVVTGTEQAPLVRYLNTLSEVAAAPEGQQ